MFNFFDVIVIVVAGLTAFLGFQTGILSSLFYIGSGFVGMWAAQHYAPGTGGEFYLVFVLVAGFVGLVGFVLSKMLKTVFFSTPDRIVGAVLGIIMGIALVATVFFPVAYHLPASMRKMVASSCSGTHLLPPMKKLFPRVEQLQFPEVKTGEIVAAIKELPGDVKDGLKDGIKKTADSLKK
jgi:uncharacterized membrane protein required for colicin V production